ncbi:MAG: helix-turn-helix domain-containing protein [Dehalococcoidia bacterium]|nr:helix-turn-helix domain-containing protein [Dehalococcoidia bacterium]
MTREPPAADDDGQGDRAGLVERRDPLALRRQLGQRIRTWRQRRGVSQAELAERVGVTQSSLSNYENGKRDVSVYILMEIAGALEVELEDLTGTVRGRLHVPGSD